MEKLSSFIIRLPAQKKNNCLSVISSNVTLEKCHLRKSRFRISRIIFKNPSKSCRDNSSDEVRYKIHSSLNSCFDVSTLKSSSPEKMNYFIESSMCSLLKSVEGIRTDSQLWQLCTQNGNCSLNLDDQTWGSLLKTNSQTIMAEVNCTEEEITTSTPPEIITSIGNVSLNHSDDIGTEDGAVIIEGNGSVSRFSNFFNSALWSIVLFLAFHFAI
ncbi:unnamed protein product [Orchesella dallaii]|uniref:Uncharacterized protein n=1 Tax=Orchesella dallaii TaxID=48710 RepID=A0ABP1RNE8_9HEXA